MKGIHDKVDAFSIKIRLNVLAYGEEEENNDTVSHKCHFSLEQFLLLEVNWKVICLLSPLLKSGKFQ